MNDCPFEDIHQHLLTHVHARFAESEAPRGVEFKCSFKGTVFQCRSWHNLATHTHTREAPVIVSPKMNTAGDEQQ